MAESSNKLLFSDYCTGSIIPIGADESGDEFISRAFMSPDGVPKQVFYSGNSWEGVSDESSQTKDELDIIAQRGVEMKPFLSQVTRILEFGPGTGLKTSKVLNLSPNVTKYRGIDVCGDLINKHILALADSHPSVECVGVPISFDKVPPLLKKSPTDLSTSFGSTLSNTSPENLKRILQVLGQRTRIILLGQDGNIDESSVKKSYSTPAFNAFIQEGIKGIYPPGNWEHGTRTLPNPFRVQRFIIAKEQIGEYEKGTIIVVFEAYKYPKEEFIAMVRAIPGFKVEAFSASNSTSCIFMITTPLNHAPAV